MGNRRYTPEQKIRFLNMLEKMETLAGAARVVGILNDEVCYRWARQKDELRAAYALSIRPGGPIKRVLRRHSKIPQEEKVRCNMDINERLSVHQAFSEFNRNLSSAQNWYRNKDGLLALYYSQQQSNAAEEDPSQKASG